MEAWVGAAGVAIGVVLTSIFEWLRNERAIKLAREVRSDERRAELWQISLPASGRLQESFAAVLRLSRAHTGFSTEPGIPFDEGFPDWWEEKEPGLQRDLALLPAPEFRVALSTVVEGITLGWEICRYGGYESSFQGAVYKIAQIGFDIVSSWMRDEQSLEKEVLLRIREVAAGLQDMEESYAIQNEAMREGKTVSN